MAFRCMRGVCLLVVLPSVHIAHGYSIAECGSDGTLTVTDTQSITLTCTGIMKNGMIWNLKQPSYSGERRIADCDWPIWSCKVTNKSVYEGSRTQFDTSILTVKLATRDSIAGEVWCFGYRDVHRSPSASCNIRVVSPKKTSPTTSKKTTPTTVSAIPAVTSFAQDDNINNNDDDDHNDDASNQTLIIAGVAAAVVGVVIIAVVTAIVVWKKTICDPTYARPTRRSQVIDTNIYTGLEPQQQGSDDQAPEEDVYEDTTGQQPAGHGTVEYVNTATGTQAAEGTVYLNV